MMTVIIRGQLFSREEKEPFVPSGYSLLGALEYNQETDELRCHECGDWFVGLSGHVRQAHNMKVADYKAKHGLRQDTSLISINTRVKIGSATKRRGGGGRKVWDGRAVSSKVDRIAGRVRHYQEAANERGRCKAQTLHKLLTLGQQLGRCPTIEEAIQVGVRHGPVRKLFGGLPFSMICEMAGLKKRVVGKPFDGNGPLSAERMLELLRKFYLDHGRVPRASDCSPGVLPCLTIYYRTFGKMCHAYRLAGIPKSAWPDLNRRMEWPEGYASVSIASASSLTGMEAYA
jgi:hypothetical protein